MEMRQQGSGTTTDRSGSAQPRPATIDVRGAAVSRPRNIRTGPRPETWTYGPDPVTHAQHIAFSRARAQANFRSEEWRLTFPQWVAIWGDQWANRGRRRHNVMLVRDDHTRAWTLDNVSVVTRYEAHTRELKRRLARGQIRGIPSRGIE